MIIVSVAVIVLCNKKTIFKYTHDDGFIENQIHVVEEKPLTININGKEFVTLLCTPEYLNELTVGFLAAEKIITSVDQIDEMLIDKEKGLVWVELTGHHKISQQSYGKRYLTSGCGRGTAFYHLSDALDTTPLPIREKMVDIELILNFSKILAKRENITGIHKAAILQGNELLVQRSDVGRHNAVDKVLGYLVLNDKNVRDGVLLSTGRISSEILTKSYTMGIPIVVSLSSPTTLALELAEKLNITVIGYAKGMKANIYTVPERIFVKRINHGKVT